MFLLLARKLGLDGGGDLVGVVPGGWKGAVG